MQLASDHRGKLWPVEVLCIKPHKHSRLMGGHPIDALTRLPRREDGQRLVITTGHAVSHYFMLHIKVYSTQVSVTGIRPWLFPVPQHAQVSCAVVHRGMAASVQFYPYDLHSSGALTCFGGVLYTLCAGHLARHLRVSA